MRDVRCRGCLARVGVANDEHNGVYCTERCSRDLVVSRYEVRDSHLELLAHLGVDRQLIIDAHGITKQRLSQVLAERRARLYPQARGAA